MFKKLLSALICPMILLPLCSSTASASATQKTKSETIVGKWIWGNTIADLGTDGAEILMSRCASEGITDVYLLIKGTGGKLGYLKTQYTDILTRNDRDVLQETIDAAHKRGIRVHAWICVVRDETYKGNHPDAGIYQYIRGRDNKFITPYNEGYREYIGNVARELAEYDIDGLHLDYVRYNHNANGWSEEDFERLASMGANLDRVKELVETTWGYNGRTEDPNYIFNAYKNNDPDAIIIAQYRKNNIKELAQHIISEARAVNPNLIFSAAIMPEGAYDSATSELHYGQSYDDAAKLYDYICPMAYSGTYGKTDNWVATVAKNSINKGNRVVMGIQAFDDVTSAHIMAEVENIRELTKDPTYKDSMLGVVFFRSGTFEYAKATYDVENKIITVKLENTGSSAYTKVRIEAKNGIRFTEAGIGDGINANAKSTLSSSGSNATFSATNLLGAGKSGYLYLKYEGDIDPDKLPVLVRIYSSSTELRIYTTVCDTSASNAERGEPKFPEPEVTTSEATESETTGGEDTSEPIFDITTDAHTEDSDREGEKKPSSLLPIIIGTAAAIAAVGTGMFILMKRKKK